MLAVLSGCGSDSDDGGSAAAATEANRPSSAELTKPEEEELRRADKLIFIYCTKDRSTLSEVEFTRATDYVANLAVLKPQAEWEEAPESSAAALTMEQQLDHQIGVIAQECPKGPGPDELWKEKLGYMKKTAQRQSGTEAS